ncbi:MAG: hypothetical protein ACRELD_09000 [Longimicrobiales bacterium]
MRCPAVLIAWIAVSACDGSAPRLTELSAVEPVDGGGFPGLLNPGAITVDQVGRVHVGDNGDRQIKTFDAEGRPLAARGGTGSGPGEFRSIQGLVAVAGHLVVLDPLLDRLVTFDSLGVATLLPRPEAVDFIGAAGPDAFLLANSALWALRAGAAPLLLRLGLDGRVRSEIGRRRAAANPFVGHIRNFAIAAGTADGALLWVAFLNDTTLLRHSVATGAWAEVSRPAPFAFRRLADDFRPSATSLAPGRRSAPPFDAVTLDIAVDARGTAYVLTALEPAGGEATTVAVDIAAADDRAIRRYLVSTNATRIGVSPDGGRLYLLDATTGMVRTFALPGR